MWLGNAKPAKVRLDSTLKFWHAFYFEAVGNLLLQTSSTIYEKIRNKQKFFTPYVSV